VLSEREQSDYEGMWSQAALSGRLLKFVPASGAATRMFQSLLWFVQEGHSDPASGQSDLRAGGSGAEGEVAGFFDHLSRFAFYDDVRAVLAGDGFDLEQVLARGQHGLIAEYLLFHKGLDYATKPKCLLKFHRDRAGRGRTALEEHLLEALEYVRDERGICRLHVTLSREHVAEVRALLSEVITRDEVAKQGRIELSDSVQHASTDTIAVDAAGNLLRDEEGRIVFRPGGHGALLRNLSDLQADIIFIKNIDNVVPDCLRPQITRWKRVLCGYLVALERKFHHFQRAWRQSPGDVNLLTGITHFMQAELGYSCEDLGISAGSHLSSQAAESLLFRPIRLCGMVRNISAPGGGPFWVRDALGRATRQIVENAQIDMCSATQRRLFESSTHFNPVDIVCSVRDYAGKAYDLNAYVDPDTYFLTTKSYAGSQIRALEHPGLWNGSMAGWATVFVEVPLVTFNPVKTVNDLLGPNHQD